MGIVLYGFFRFSQGACSIYCPTIENQSLKRYIGQSIKIIEANYFIQFKLATTLAT